MAELEGEAEMVAAILAMITRVEAATRRGVVRAAHVIEARVKMQLTSSSHPPGTPTPSLPGQPPSLVTGSLRRSIGVVGPEGHEGRWSASVVPSIVYGRIHELGGVAGRGAQLPARPYLRPGMAAAEAQVDRVITQAWRDAIDQ